jgi:GDP-L-fucose synthase
MQSNSSIFVAGHGGMVGSAIVRDLQKRGFRVLTTSKSEMRKKFADPRQAQNESQIRDPSERHAAGWQYSPEGQMRKKFADPPEGQMRKKFADLRDSKFVEKWFETHRPDYVILAAAKVGGILANRDHKAEFIYDNLMIQTNVIHNAWKFGCRKLLFLGSSCIYPRDAPNPIQESSLLSGPLESTNSAYAVAKIAGIEMCRAYREQYGFNAIAVMPTNLYGPNDNYDPQNSHVFASLIRKFSDAVKNHDDFVELWGDGTPRREFMHVDDLASACLFLMNTYDAADIVNIGSGTDIRIADLAEEIRRISKFDGQIRWDTSKPNGTMQKLMDSSRLYAMGWAPRIGLEEGIRKSLEDYASSS